MYTLSNLEDQDIWQGDFNKEEILAKVKEYLQENPEDELTFSRKMTKAEMRVWAGDRKDLDFYCNHKGMICKMVVIGQKTFYKKLD
jgi:hypothetical protein